MSLFIDQKTGTITTVTGEGSDTIIINNAILMQIFINPTTSSTTYDFKLTDIDSKVTFQETNCQGEFNRLLSFPVYGNYVLTIENPSVDEAFTYKLVFRRA